MNSKEKKEKCGKITSNNILQVTENKINYKQKTEYTENFL